MRCASPAAASPRIRFTCAGRSLLAHWSLDRNRYVYLAVAVEVDVRAVVLHPQDQRRLGIPNAPFLVLHAQLESRFAIDAHDAEERIRAGVIAPREADARAQDDRRRG